MVEEVVQHLLRDPPVFEAQLVGEISVFCRGRQTHSGRGAAPAPSPPVFLPISRSPLPRRR
eukprot:11220321-Lingulodinium_polyedra.AAC.1